MSSGAYGPTPLRDRALGPDLARGSMLLAIALANSHYFLTGDRILGGYPQGGSAIDSAMAWLLATLVDGRAFPMFGLLFGYGVAHIVARQRGVSRWSVRRLLWRRSAILVAVGVVDGMLFFVGDILAMYGVLLFLGAFVVFWRDRWLLVVAVGIFAMTALPSAEYVSTITETADVSMLPPDLATMFTERPVVVGFIALVGPVGFACPFLVGLVVGRHRLLERPERHRRLLTAVAAIGITISIMGAQPVALVVSGAQALPGPEVIELIGPLHDATGVLGGFGYAAVAALAAQRLGSTDRVVVRALAATGQTSMTCYLLQSFAWAIVFTPFLLDLSGTLSVTSTALLATAVWLSSVAVADRLRRNGHRGPFESLVRRVSYGGRTRTSSAA